MFASNQIYLGDSQELLKKLDDKLVSLVICSPPYKDIDNYSESLIKNIFTECYRIQKDNSLCFVNFGHLANQKSRPFQVVNILENIGYRLNDTITWLKTQFSPIQGNKRLNNLTEFIFIFYKGKMPKLDRLSIGVPYQCKDNIGRYSDKDLRCGGNIWKFGYETIQNKSQKLHNDRFPIELPIRCIKLSNIKDNEIICDPFSGSATVAVAARKLNKQFIGFEINENNWKIGNERLGKYEI